MLSSSLLPFLFPIVCSIRQSTLCDWQSRDGRDRQDYWISVSVRAELAGSSNWLGFLFASAFINFKKFEKRFHIRSVGEPASLLALFQFF
jgi:hypothetical protein